MKNSLPEAMRLLRVYHEKSLTVVAKDLGVSVSYLSEIENGKKDKPSLEFLRSYAKYFDVKLSALLFFDEQLSESNFVGKGKTFLREKMIIFLKAFEHAANQKI